MAFEYVRSNSAAEMHKTLRLPELSAAMIFGEWASPQRNNLCLSGAGQALLV